ncbi:hypothetical protein KP509_14G032000 [Ceratopteris richardii]|uniref:Uncharacterized protein n=1 Tax=Ceratopteris richardii TaxID=49495 RepID=A0A8T2T949_CERRI|nr:hypothetical protein KP509_14G032000 [Ceratopteris richardii]
MAQEALLKDIYSNEKEPDSKNPIAVDEVKVETEDANQQAVLIAEGVPLLGTPQVQAPASPWSTGLCACLGNNDEFCSSDLEVCLLGSTFPCVLYASNAERLQPTVENTFSNHLLAYCGLFCLGNLLCGFNALAPCFSSSYRTNLRKTYNLTGSGCSNCCGENANHECVDNVADFAIHYLCHPCALCQEGREIRRRVPHPGFIRSYMAMEAPSQQVMSP